MYRNRYVCSTALVWQSSSSPPPVLDKCSQGCPKRFFSFLSTEDFGQKVHSVSTLQVPPHKSMNMQQGVGALRWYWLGCQQQGAGCRLSGSALPRQARGQQCGQKNVSRWLSQLVPFCLDHLLGRLCSSHGICPWKPTWKDAVPALLPAFKSWLCRLEGSGDWGFKGGQGWSLVGGKDCWVDVAGIVMDPGVSCFACPWDLTFWWVLAARLGRAQPGSHTAPRGWCGTHPALHIEAGGDGGQGCGVNTWAGAAGVVRVHIPQQRTCRQVKSPSAEASFACAQCTWECWFTAVLVSVQKQGASQAGLPRWAGDGKSGGNSWAGTSLHTYGRCRGTQPH